MIPINITYFYVSPETVFAGSSGHIIKLSYRFDVDDDLLNGEMVKYCNFVENVVFRLEWKRLISANESILICAREINAYPTKSFMLSKQNHRSAKCFLSRELLTVEPNFKERAEIFCRISLHPVVAAKRQTIEYQPHGKYYILDNKENGPVGEYDTGEIGAEY